MGDYYFISNIFEGGALIEMGGLFNLAKKMVSLSVVPHFSLSPLRVAFSRLVWGDFHAHSCFARSTIPEEKWGTILTLLPTCVHVCD